MPTRTEVFLSPWRGAAHILVWLSLLHRKHLMEVTPEVCLGLQKTSMRTYALPCSRAAFSVGPRSLPSTDDSHVHHRVGRSAQSGQSGMIQRSELREVMAHGGRDAGSGQRKWTQALWRHGQRASSGPQECNMRHCDAACTPHRSAVPCLRVLP